MSSNIKFRVFNPQSRQFEYFGFDIGFKGFKSIPTSKLMTIDYVRKNSEQYIGLKDKNGKDIYEGDIVKYYQPYLKRVDTHIVARDYYLACFGLFEKDNKWCKESDWLKIEDIEIIGNIHQNKELLNA